MDQQHATRDCSFKFFSVFSDVFSKQAAGLPSGPSLTIELYNSNIVNASQWSPDYIFHRTVS